MAETETKVLADPIVKMALFHLICMGVGKVKACELLEIHYGHEMTPYQCQPGVRGLMGRALRISRTGEFSRKAVRELLEEAAGEPVPRGWVWDPHIEWVGPLTPEEVLGLPTAPMPDDDQIEVLAAGVVRMDEDPKEREPSEPPPPLPPMRPYPGLDALLDYTWTLATNEDAPLPARIAALDMLHKRERHMDTLETRRHIARERRKAAGAPAFGGTGHPERAAQPRERGLRMAAVEEIQRTLIGPKPLRQPPHEQVDDAMEGAAE